MPRHRLRPTHARPAGADMLIVKRDRDEPLVVLPMSLAIEIAKAAERGRA